MFSLPVPLNNSIGHPESHPSKGFVIKHRLIVSLFEGLKQAVPKVRNSSTRRISSVLLLFVLAYVEVKNKSSWMWPSLILGQEKLYILPTWLF